MNLGAKRGVCGKMILPPNYARMLYEMITSPICGALGIDIPEPAWEPRPTLWPTDIKYGNGVCAWQNRKFVGHFSVPRNQSTELFRVPPEHPAYGRSSGLGVRATKRIMPGETICHYGSEMFCQSDIVPDSDGSYLMCTSKKNSKFIYDARCFGNEMRFINDVRGLSDRPNVELGECVALDNAPDWVTACPIIAIMVIEPGTEILLNYGQAYWKGVYDNYRECEQCYRVLQLDEFNFARFGTGFRKVCSKCIGNAQQVFFELDMNAVDHEYYGSSFCVVAVDSFDGNLVNVYLLADDKHRWTVEQYHLYPLREANSDLIAAQEVVEVRHEENLPTGIVYSWWRAMVDDVFVGAYRITYERRFDGHIWSTTVPASKVRKVTKRFQVDITSNETYKNLKKRELTDDEIEIDIEEIDDEIDIEEIDDEIDIEEIDDEIDNPNPKTWLCQGGCGIRIPIYQENELVLHCDRCKNFRTCSICIVEKPLNADYYHRGGPNGFRTTCKKCRNSRRNDLKKRRIAKGEKETN